MHVAVNETNIAVYELDKLTGNSREDLLKWAKESEESGVELFCQIPDQPDNKIEVNAFEHFDSEPAPKPTCRYEVNHMGEGGEDRYVCIIHGHTSKHDVQAEPTSPCKFIDPED